MSYRIRGRSVSDESDNRAILLQTDPLFPLHPPAHSR